MGAGTKRYWEALMTWQSPCGATYGQVFASSLSEGIQVQKVAVKSVEGP